MGKTLERDLGLFATISISIGAMIGSGIFVLPGIAAKIAGPAVIVAYLLAGLVVLPAALSKAEMATAMPEAGGTYLYIDRAMGPMPGTIAGVGAWFSLVFKSAFALVGLGAYLLLFVDISASVVELVALALGVALLVLNIAGAKQTGRLQTAVVAVVLSALLIFIADGITTVDQSFYRPFLPNGNAGLLAATGFVFVSYAGVTKIASVAEEVEDPGRTLPIGILGSILVMMLVYTFVVFVVIGVSPPGELMQTDMYTPMALAAEQFLGPTGKIAIAVIAVLALTSMANAGILSSTRFPLAMSRDDLAPNSLARIHPRFRTPTNSIVFTGIVLLALIVFVDVIELAKLASAFQILVFTFVNGALIAFRESDLVSYDPEFTAPFYPWMQLFGIGGGLVLLTQMGAVPLVGALGLVVGGFLWYQIYGRERTEREGAALDAIRGASGEYSVARTEERLAIEDGHILVAVTPETTTATENSLLAISHAIARRQGADLSIVRFDEVPEQVPLSHAAAEQTPADVAFEEETTALTSGMDVDISMNEVVSHDIEHGIANYVAQHDVDLLVGQWTVEFPHAEFAGHDVDWFMKHVDAETLFVRDRDVSTVDEIVVVGDRGPLSPLEVFTADSLATAFDATVRIVHAIDDAADSEHAARARTYHEDLAALCTADVETELISAPADREDALVEAAGDADLVVASTSAHHVLYDVVFGSLPDRLTAELDATLVFTHENRPRRRTFLRHLLERLVY